MPTLDTIEDSNGHKTDENLTLDETLTSTVMKTSDEFRPKVILSIGNVNLTESSSSGSVCESVVTAYEQNGKKKEKTSSDEKLAEVKPGGLEGIFKSSQNLLKKTPKPRKESEASSFAFNPIQFNYEDFSASRIDHRVKLFVFQKILEDNDEKIIWLVKSLTIEDEAGSSGIPSFSLLIMTTKKFYVMKIVGEQSEDIGKWLKLSIFCTIDNIAAVRPMPSKVGLTFELKTKANIHALLRDQNVTDRLLIHITTSSKLSL